MSKKSIRIDKVPLSCSLIQTTERLYMTLLEIYRSNKYPGFFEVNQLYHTITEGNTLFEIRYRQPMGGNGFNAPSETLFTDPDRRKLLERFRAWEPSAVRVTG